MRRRALALAVALWAACASGVAARDLAPKEIEVRATPITHFRFGSSDSRFGALDFVGGLELSASAREFGQLSAMRFLTPGGDFIGVADHGYWFYGTIERDGHVPAGVSRFRMQPMVDATGNALLDKADQDAEGLDVHEGVVTVAFERNARLAEFALAPGAMGRPLRHLDFVIPRRELRSNQGIETLARAPAGGALDGARVVVAERSVDGDGNIFAAIIEGKHKGVFKVRRSDSFDVTDGVFLPDGDLLLLERRFSPLVGVGMRLRRIAGTAIRPGALVDGPVLMQADLAYRIDNMEAVDVWRRDDGALVVSLLSDDNQSFLQRTLYLEFVLVE